MLKKNKDVVLQMEKPIPICNIINNGCTQILTAVQLADLLNVNSKTQAKT